MLHVVVALQDTLATCRGVAGTGVLTVLPRYCRSSRPSRPQL